MNTSKTSTILLPALLLPGIRVLLMESLQESVAGGLARLPWIPGVLCVRPYLLQK